MAVSPFKFLQEVRSETAKVTWPTCRDHDHHHHGVRHGRGGLDLLLRRRPDHPRPHHLPFGHSLMATATAQLSDKRWYIVHAYSNFEKKVQESIREQAKQRGLEDLFEQILVPTEKVTEVRRGRKIDAERKFFPGYVLVKMKLTDEAFHLIKNTPKVTGFLGAENKPMPISESEAMRILHRGAGGCGTAEGVGVVRDRRERARGRWPVRLVLGCGRGNRRGALAREGRGVDLRPRHAGRAGIRAGREGLTG